MLNKEAPSISAPSSTTDTEPLELQPLEVHVNLDTLAHTVSHPTGFCFQCGTTVCCDDADVDELVYGRLFEKLRRAGIELGRPFTLVVYDSSRMATARQDPWRAE